MNILLISLTFLSVRFRFKMSVCRYSYLWPDPKQEHWQKKVKEITCLGPISIWKYLKVSSEAAHIQNPVISV